MRKRFFSTLVVLCMILALLPVTTTAAGAQQEVHVSSAKELLQAIKSNTKIILEDKDYNLYTKETNWEPCIDLEGCENVTIQGTGKTQILTETNTDVVINLSKCKNITLSGLILGHNISPKDQCMAGVVQMSNSENVVIDNCDLFGCGLLGISTYNSTLMVTNSTIRDCSKSMLEISRGNATFKNCIFSNNGHGFIRRPHKILCKRQRVTE